MLMLKPLPTLLTCQRSTYYSCCAKCNKSTNSAIQSRYANPVSHARSCFEDLEERYHEYMYNLYDDDKDKAVKVQQGLLKAMWMEIVMCIWHIILKISGMITQLR